MALNWERTLAGVALTLICGDGAYAAQKGPTAIGDLVAAAIIGLPVLFLLFPGRVSRRLSAGFALALLAVIGARAALPADFFASRLSAHAIYIGFV